MRRRFLLSTVILITAFFIFSFEKHDDKSQYLSVYTRGLADLRSECTQLLRVIDTVQLYSETVKNRVREQINKARIQMKAVDFWVRYLEPLAQKRINGPLPVEWETEVFEKFEKPYKRDGAGFTLAYLYLDEENIEKDSLKNLITAVLNAIPVYEADSITDQLYSYHHFYLCNRLFLLNLAAIYTTGFECPDAEQVIPELRNLLDDVAVIYTAFNSSYPETALKSEYISLYRKLIDFIAHQPDDIAQFDHFVFLRDYINPLYAINQQLILGYKVVSRSMIDYSLNKNAKTIFDKDVYYGQNSKGIFLRVKDTASLTLIDKLGRLLFYDPILSGNNQRSCASCHNPNTYFTDTLKRTSFHFDHIAFLRRNTPSLINSQYNHLLMLDGKHYTLQNQARGVIANHEEMNCAEVEVLKKILSCKEYKEGLTKLLVHTPQEAVITMDHIVSAVTFYYTKFSRFYAPFDEAINNRTSVDKSVHDGFNLFMSKAQCATCHFVPQFNGVKPPYIGSEFEVLGVPGDNSYKQLSQDKGRYGVNPAVETMNAFRTTTVRNAAHTFPYMHNGVFRSLNEVVDFYDKGGGAGRGLPIPNQTLSSDSLKLTMVEKKDLIAFIQSLNENIVFDNPPQKLPRSTIKSLNGRKVGGIY